MLVSAAVAEKQTAFDAIPADAHWRATRPLGDMC